MSSRAVPEVEIPRPQAGEEMDVGEPGRLAGPADQPAPTVGEWVDHRVQEPELDQVQEQMKRTQMIVKRNMSDSPAHKTWRVEDVVGDAADAAPSTNEQLRAEQDRGVRED